MKTSLTSLLFVLLGISALAQTPVNFRLNLEKGNVYTVKTTSKQTMQQTVSGQQYAVDIYSNRVVSCKVLSQEQEVMEIVFTYDTIASKISAPMFTRETNSANPGTEPLERIMNKMSTYPLKAKISTTGKFIGFTNYSMYKDNVLFVIDSLPASKKDEARKQADILLKESALKSLIEPLFAYFPDKPVNTGDAWETSYLSTSNDITTVVLNAYTLKGLENNQATIVGTSTMETLPSKDPDAQITQELKGTSAFAGTLDLATGLVVKSTENSHLEGEATVRNAGTVMKVQMKVDSQSEIIMFH